MNDPSEENTDNQLETPAERAEPANQADEAQARQDADFASRSALPAVLEAILFASQKPTSTAEFLAFLKGAAAENPEHPIATALRGVTEPEIGAAIEHLRGQYTAEGRAFGIRETAAGFQLATSPEFAPWLRQLYPENRPARLSAPALETLAIIAYRQPIPRADIEAVRGVSVDGVMQTLLDRGLVKIAGRAEIPGRPLLYETTQFFMEHFGLKNLDELPNATELRAVPLPKPAAKPAPEPAPESQLPLELAPGPEPESTGEETTAGEEAGSPP